MNKINEFFMFNAGTLEIPLIYVPHRVSGNYIAGEDDAQELKNISAEVLWAIEASHHKRVKRLGIPDSLEGLKHLLEISNNDIRMIAANRFFYNYKTASFVDIKPILDEAAENGRTVLRYISGNSGEIYEPLTHHCIEELMQEVEKLKSIRKI